MTTRIKSPRKRKSTSTVKLRTNGKHKIDAASTIRAPVGMDRILRPQARFNWLMPNVASITPQYIEMLLNGALAGNHVQRWELFDLMLRTWPELSACCQELTYGVLRKKLIYEPFQEEDEKPTPSALERMKVCSAALRRMSPDPITDGADLNGTIRDILDAWFRGCSVSEIIWDTVDDKVAGTIVAPNCTYWVYPVCYAFTSDNVIGMMPPTISKGGTWPFSSTTNIPTNQAQVIPFPDNKFLVSVHKTKSGSPLSGPLLVPLCWWWCAANFSSDWLLNLAQVFGLPFRWTTYAAGAPQETINAICNMLQNMGSNAWAAFPEGTKMDLIDSNKSGSDHSPQGELLDRADRYARNLILGQTMTGSHGTTGKGGGQAFGEVEADVKSDRIDAAGSFAAEIINNQLIKFVLQLNYGDTEEPPTIKFLEDDVAGLPQAQTYKTLADAGMEIGVDHIRKVFDIPEPADGEDVIGGAKPAPSFGGFGGQDFGQQDSNSPDAENPTETKAPNEESDESAGSVVQTPQGIGTVVSTDKDGALVSIDGIIRIYYKYSEITAGGSPAGHKFRGNQYTGGIPDTEVYAAWIERRKQVALASGKFDKPTIEEFFKRYKEFDSLPAGKIAPYMHEYDPAAAYAARMSGITADGMSRLRAQSEGIPIPQIRAELEKQKGIKSSDQTGHPFRGNQYVSLGSMVETPHGRGTVVANDQGGAWVSVNGSIRKYKYGEIKRAMKPFPSLLPSEENKRRLMRNAGLQTKLEELNEIQDDAVFSRELEALVNLEVHPASVIQSQLAKPEPPPQVINVHVEAPAPTAPPTNKTFTIKRSDGTVIEGEIAAKE